TDHALQLRDVVDGLVLHIVTTRMHIRALVTRKMLQERLPQGPKEPLYSWFIRWLMRCCRLNIDPSPRARTPDMIREISLSMINNNRPGNGPQRCFVLPGPDDEIVWDPVIGKSLCVFLRWRHHLVKHIGNVTGISRNRRQSKTDDAAAEQI